MRLSIIRVRIRGGNRVTESIAWVQGGAFEGGPFRLGNRLEPGGKFDSHDQTVTRKYRNRITIGPGSLIGFPGDKTPDRDAGR